MPEQANKWTIKDMVESKAMSEEMAIEIGLLVHNGCSTVVAGDTASGKTTALNALLDTVSLQERVITIENNTELSTNHERPTVPFEVDGTPGPSGKPASSKILIHNSLRMRPNRVVVGDVDETNAYALIRTMDTGHYGSMTTIHAKGITEGIDRLARMVTESGSVDQNSAYSLIASAVDLFVVVKRYQEGVRRVSGIYEIPTEFRTNTETETSTIEPIPLWEWVQGNGDVKGHYEKRNAPSPSLVKRRGLDNTKKMSLEELYELSGS